MDCGAEQISDYVSMAVWGFGLLATFDMAMNAAAGGAAADLGARLNGFSPDGLAVRMGALAGTTKAALLIFREIVNANGVNLVFWVLLFLITSSFGICPLIVTEISNLVVGESEFLCPSDWGGGRGGKGALGVQQLIRVAAPRELVIAGVVAAIPLFFETIRNIKPDPSEQNDGYFRWVSAEIIHASSSSSSSCCCCPCLNSHG